MDMNKIDTILREAKGKILTRKDFDSLATKYKFDRETLRRVMLNKGYLITIFRGVYYLKDYEEKKLNSLKYSPYELLALGLEKKNVKWYFGLNTALKFLGLTHEVFPVNIVINDKFNRTRPMKIAGSSFFFIKLKPSLFFDMKKENTENNISIYYSNIEKTLLDMIYLKKSLELNEYKFNKSLFLKESSKYNQIVKKRIKELL
ncbi:MAG: type IV toxin-antitoxin system AbiEi family antitoxin domain-containing protein [archaeon]